MTDLDAQDRGFTQEDLEEEKQRLRRPVFDLTFETLISGVAASGHS